MKISKKIITGIFGFSFMLGLVGCSQSTNTNANLAKIDEVQTPTVEEQILMTDQIKLQKEKLLQNEIIKIFISDNLLICCMVAKQK